MPGTTKEPVYYSVTQVAEMLGVNRKSVRKWIEDGQLEALRFEGAIGFRIEAGELEQFIARRRVRTEVDRRMKEL